MTQWLESADYVARFRSLDERKVNAGAVAFPAPVPETVTARLAPLGLTWDVLPTLVRQALLWDLGLVVGNVSGTDAYLQVYTKCGMGMANISLTFDEFTAANPSSQTVRSCPASVNGATVSLLRQEAATGTFLDDVIKCAMDLQNLPDGSSSLLAQDGLGPSDVPQPRVWRHQDKSAGWTKLAIHTLPVSLYPEAAWSTCPSRPAARIIPCEPRNNRPESLNTCLPTPSTAMTSWLTAVKASLPAKDSTGGLSTTNIVLIATICGVVLLALLGCCLWRRRRHAPSPPSSPKYEQPIVDGSTDPSRYMEATTPPSPAQQPPSFARSGSSVEVALHELYRDPSVACKQLVYKELDWIRILAAGAFGEVYLGQYRQKRIAIKRIQSIRIEIEGVVEAFAEEIRLMAHFRHPNIVAFLGFAWDLTSPSTLCAVTEYLPEGDLKAYLLANPVLPWSTKMVFALDVARALQYLHELLEPTIIHRDLKSKNILLALPHAKLSDFGISREQINDDTLTAGVGTAFYSAPEVMKGLKYTKQADIYSFGCVLAEMDTHKSLYHEWKFPAIAILNKVMHENLRPAMTATCPRAILELARQCFHADPNQRPTASDIARDLADLVGKGRIERHAWKSSESS
ncbi:TKL/DRK protein kinase [Saprolegnia diclina VS20]|uniref:TKL/DRK protein kinase n=1 Tax=Saprolegnia diclina (strain VS20) TaxID=1156394 RepID=T0R2M4_SAPDV|nr:TKL/DRK protein kinase [Saprolegnia diclina VS20]EQC26278.1 TKL/DRK protein kinase [Saprolegnia diclina VS20]|eukprot:XP_008620273.1 TKL/DRK protein kinase [Saprolegnia diclina VS20]